VFLWAVPVAALGLVVALVLPQVSMRGTAREAVRSPGEGFAMPTDPGSDAQLETLIGRIVRRNKNLAADVLARAGVAVDIPTAWGLLGVHMRDQVLGLPTSQADIEDQVRIPHGVLTSFYDGIVTDGYLARADDRLELTADGRAVVSAIGDAWTHWLVEQLADWAVQTDHTAPADLDERVRAAVRRIARRIMLEQQHELQPA
jgi:hypothetical protein